MSADSERRYGASITDCEQSLSGACLSSLPSVGFRRAPLGSDYLKSIARALDQNRSKLASQRARGQSGGPHGTHSSDGQIDLLALDLHRLNWHSGQIFHCCIHTASELSTALGNVYIHRALLLAPWLSVSGLICSPVAKCKLTRSTGETCLLSIQSGRLFLGHLAT